MEDKNLVKRVAELGKQISEDYKGESVTLVCTLRGASIFFADLVREIEGDVEIDIVPFGCVDRIVGGACVFLSRAGSGRLRHRHNDVCCGRLALCRGRNQLFFQDEENPNGMIKLDCNKKAALGVRTAFVVD